MILINFRKFSLALIGLVFCIPAFAQDDLIGNIFSRKTTSLNGEWQYIIDPYETGFYNYRYQERGKNDREAYWNSDQPRDKTDRMEHGYSDEYTINVPGDWNSQDRVFLYYEGTVWYKKSFDYSKSNVDSRLFLYFGAVNYQADVYLNGTRLGGHKGGFTPFQFEIPVYANITRNPNQTETPCWFDINFTSLNASIYISYKPVNNNINDYLEDSRTLAFKHTVKAFDIEQNTISFPERNVYGLVYEIEGNTASSYQFHLTDSNNHFIRGSLYFNNAPNQDSIQPVLTFIKKDIEQIFNTLECFFSADFLFFYKKHLYYLIYLLPNPN